MSSDPETIYELFWRARRQKGLTQTELARETGCSQSAISMFESGRPDALSKEKVSHIAVVLGVDVSAAAAAPVGTFADVETAKFCPVAECPSNVPYTVRGELNFLPRMERAPVSEKTRCRLCGEFLEAACPNPGCGAPCGEGAFCARCGTAYVTPPSAARGPAASAWAERQRGTIAELHRLSRNAGAARPEIETAG